MCVRRKAGTRSLRLEGAWCSRETEKRRAAGAPAGKGMRAAAAAVCRAGRSGPCAPAGASEEPWQWLVGGRGHEHVPLATGWRADCREPEWRQETTWESVTLGHGGSWAREAACGMEVDRVDRRHRCSGSEIGRIGDRLVMAHEGGKVRVAPVTCSRGWVVAPFAETGATEIEPGFWEETLGAGHVRWEESGRHPREGVGLSWLGELA